MISKTTSAGNGTSNPKAARPELGDELGDLGELRRHLARFLVIGVGSVAVDLAVYQIVTAAALLAVHPAKGVSYLAGMVLGFFGNKFWTFSSARKSLSEPVMYAVLYTATLAVNIGVNAAVLALLGESRKLFAFFAATGVTTVLNFIGLRLLTFRVGIRERRQRMAA